MARHVQQIHDQVLLVQPVVAKAVAADACTGLKEPFGAHRPGVHGRRQERLHVVTGLEQVAVQFLALRQLVSVTKLMLEHLAPHLQDAAMGQRLAAKHALAFNKSAVGGATVADHQLVVVQLQLAMHARDFGVAKDQFTGRAPADAHRLHAQTQTLRLTQLVGVNQIVHPALARRLNRLVAARGADHGALTVVHGFQAGAVVCGTQDVSVPRRTNALLRLFTTALLVGPGAEHATAPAINQPRSRGWAGIGTVAALQECGYRRAAFAQA